MSPMGLLDHVLQRLGEKSMEVAAQPEEQTRMEVIHSRHYFKLFEKLGFEYVFVT